MSRLSRRTIFKGSLAAAGTAALSHVSGGRLIRAQNAAYEIVSFGPIADGVMAEGFYWPQMGNMQGIHGSGTAFGHIATSAEKFTPCLFNSDGTTTKLKSGTYGGRTIAMNSSGTVVGASYDTIDGQGERFTTLEQPVAWVDGEFIRLPVPDAESETASRTGSARYVSEDGVIMGSGNGHSLRWTNGEAEILPRQLGDGSSLNYIGMLPDGSLIVLQYVGSTRTYQTGVLNGDAVEPFARVGAVAEAQTPNLVGVNSVGAALLYTFFIGSTTAAYAGNIVKPGEDTIEIDPRADGISFRPNGFNASNQVVGPFQPRDGVDAVPAIWDAGEFTMLEDLLPADHGYHMLIASGISDDGIIAGSGWDEDGAFHPLLFIPA
jgi:hypothetical protein